MRPGDHLRSRLKPAVHAGTAHPGRTGDERGEVIILVLAILVAVGIVVGAMAALATPIFAHAATVQSVDDTASIADSGLQYGIQVLRTVPGFCSPSTPQLMRNVPALHARGGVVSAQVQCSTVSSAGTISNILITSTVAPGNGVNRAISARAVVELNTATQATTVESWRVCQDPAATC